MLFNKLNCFLVVHGPPLSLRWVEVESIHHNAIPHDILHIFLHFLHTCQLLPRLPIHKIIEDLLVSMLILGFRLNQRQFRRIHQIVKMGQVTSHFGDEIFLSIRFVEIMMINNVVDIFEIRSFVVIVQMVPTFLSNLLKSIPVFELLMIDVQSFQNIKYFKSVRDFMNLTVHNWNMHFFSSCSQEIGHNDASEESIVVSRLISNHKVTYFWDCFC